MVSTDLITHAKLLLKEAGYVVIPRERHIVVQSRYMVPPHDLNYSRVERYEDMVRQKMLRDLICEADHAGLVLHARQDLNDPVTGREVVFTSAMGMIKPKESA